MVCKRLQIVLQNLDETLKHPLWHILNMERMSEENVI